jgi:hypothetical protein
MMSEHFIKNIETHPFDYEHPNFNELKTKLKNLFEGMI